MQYLIMLHFSPGEGPQEGTPEDDAEMERWGELTREMRDAGVVIGVSGLQLEAVTTVRKNSGELHRHRRPVRRDEGGPLSLHRRRRGSRRRAGVAAKMPSTEYGSVEVRPMVGYEAG